MKVSKRFVSLGISAALFFAAFVTLAAFAAAGFAADEPDPLGGMYNLVPKSGLHVTGVLPGYRSVVGYQGQDPDGYTTGKYGAVTANLPIPSGWSVYGLASAAGVVPGETSTIEFLGKAYPNISKGVVCNAYIAMSDYHAGSSGSIVWELVEPDGSASGKSLGLLYDGSVFTSDYSYLYPSMVASDWDGDGYSDYILTYRTWWYGNNYFSPRISFSLWCTYVDGKSLYNAVTEKDVSLIQKTQISPYASLYGSTYTNDTINDGYDHYTGTDLFHGAPQEVQTALGDVDGDGVMEFVVVSTADSAFWSYYSSYDGSRYTYDSSYAPGISVCKVEVSGGAARFNQIFGNITNNGYYYFTPVSTSDANKNLHVSVAMGDINGDGYDDVWVVGVDANGNASPAGAAWISDGKGGFSSYTGSGWASIMNGWQPGSNNVRTAIADLDGDGRKEAIALVGQVLNVCYYDAQANTWKAAASKTLSNVVSGAVNFDRLLMTGYFSAPDYAALSSGKNPPLQIAVVSHTLNYNLHVGAYGWSGSGGFTTIGGEYMTDPATYADTDYNNASSHGEFGSVLAIAAPDRSLAVGPPAVLQASGNATPTVIMQAPPRHRDIVSGDFTAGGRSTANPPDALGNSYPDVFSNLGGYSTQYLSNGSTQTISSDTRNSSVKAGVKLNTQTSGGVPLLYSVSFNAAVSYSNDKASSYTESETHTTTISLQSDAAADDAIYYNETSYTMWRYPVLAPSWERTAVAADGSEGQAFLQFIVAHSASTQSLPTSGLGLDWYQPNHDVRNLFTYPRDVTKTMGYPAGAGDGIVLGSSSEVYIGAQDAASGQTTFSDAKHTEDMSSVENKLGISVGVGTKILTNGDYSLNTTMDEMWKTSSITTTNASSTQGVTLKWPGMLIGGGTQTYVNRSGFARTDQTFHAATALYTQDDGALATAYAVTRLKDTSSSSFLWGNTSPYAKTPDPGLLLPFRFNTDSGAHNTSAATYKLRGMNFDKAIYLNTLPTGVETTGTFRIYNYSFVNTAQPITWQVLYQKAAVADGYPEDPDLSKATAISGASGTVPIIAGREYDAASDNWTDVSFKWRAPSVEENGYLHVKLTYSGAQLSVDNDWGHVYVGTYAGYTDSLGASGRGIASDGGITAEDSYESGENLDLRIHDLTVRDVDGNVLDPDALPQNEPFYIDCDVALDRVGEPADSGTPIVYLALLVNGESPVASQHTPYMPHDSKYRFHIRYDPTLHRDLVELKTLVAEATSHLGVHKADANPDNHAVTMRFADGSRGGSGSGGCGAGFGLFGLLAMLTAVPLAMKKTKKMK